jgi:hypothetical protein
MMEIQTDFWRISVETERKFSLSSWLRSPGGLVLLAFLLIAAFYLVTEHTAHVFGFLPYALLLLCPLLHLFMHGGHGGHGDGDTRSRGQRLVASGHKGHGEHGGHTRAQGQSPAGGER